MLPEIGFREHLAHQRFLLDADAVLARKHAALGDAEFQNVGAEFLRAFEFVFGLAHGLGWIAMCGLSLAAVRARVIPLRLGFAVAVIGAIGPFVGSYEFVREQRRRDADAAAAEAALG